MPKSPFIDFHRLCEAKPEAKKSDLILSHCPKYIFEHVRLNNMFVNHRRVVHRQVAVGEMSQIRIKKLKVIQVKQIYPLSSKFGFQIFCLETCKKIGFYFYPILAEIKCVFLFIGQGDGWANCCLGKLPYWAN